MPSRSSGELLRARAVSRRCAVPTRVVRGCRRRCRQRTEAGAGPARQNDTIDVHSRDIQEERATKRVKHDEVQAKASSSWGAPCYGSPCLADVESKDIAIEEEHPKEKRDNVCELPEEHVMYAEDGAPRRRR